MNYLLVLTAAILVSLGAAADPPIVPLSSIKRGSIDTSTISISGISSGGIMSVTMHYIFSSKIKAGGSFAGGPFAIAYNVSSTDFLPAKIFGIVGAVFPIVGRSANDLETRAKSYASRGLIDSLTNLKGAPAYIYQGALDPVNPIVGQLSAKASSMYTYFGSIVKELNILTGTHCVPTDNYGLDCAIFNPINDGVNNCHIESIFEMFSHFFGSSYKKPKSSTIPYNGTIYNFDQTPYCANGNCVKSFMNGYGGIYVPKVCEDPASKCKLHIALHGCLQTIYSNFFIDIFAQKAGYLQAADANKIIVVFPRAAAVGLQFPDKTSAGCWDWFGLTVPPNVPFKEMPQIKSMTNILNAGLYQRNDKHMALNECVCHQGFKQRRLRGCLSSSDWQYTHDLREMIFRLGLASRVAMMMERNVIWAKFYMNIALEQTVICEMKSTLLVRLCYEHSTNVLYGFGMTVLVI